MSKDKQTKSQKSYSGVWIHQQNILRQPELTLFSSKVFAAVGASVDPWKTISAAGAAQPI